MLRSLSRLIRAFVSSGSPSRCGFHPAFEPIEPRLLLATFVLYVDAGFAASAPDGLSWCSAYADLQSALDAASPGPDDNFEIRVADGTYWPTSGTSPSATFSLKSRVALYGGYAGNNSADSDERDIAAWPAILSGNIGNADLSTDNSYHVVTGSGVDATAILDGFTITGGFAGWRDGGGMYIDAGSPTIRNCTFGANTAKRGGGMYARASSAVLVNCSFDGNSTTPGADGAGGGLCNDNSSPTLANCTFFRNSADIGGGGMYNLASSSPLITGCDFSGNSAVDRSAYRGRGGAMLNVASSPTLVNCTFAVNSAYSGGGMYNDASSPTVTNCTFSANYASAGSSMYNDQASSKPSITNCIMWGANGSRPIYNSSDWPTINGSNIWGGYDVGTGIINADPLFYRNPGRGPDATWGTADDDYGDLRLRLESPCIDAGWNDRVPADVTTDLDGNPRFADIPAVRDTGFYTAPIVDMGAFEACPPPAPLYLPVTNGPDAFTLRLSPDGLSLQYWRAASVDGDPAAAYPLSSLTTCYFFSSLDVDILRLDFSYGVPITAEALRLPADDQIIVTADDETRPERVRTVRELLASARITSVSFDPARALSPTVIDNGDILIRLTLRGDLNSDDVLDGDDYFALDRAWLMQDDLTPQADLTLDNRVDTADYLILDRAFLALAPPALATNAPSSNLFSADPSPLQDLLL